jgi:Phosphoenolpyruvate phosphomutase
VHQTFQRSTADLGALQACRVQESAFLMAFVSNVSLFLVKCHSTRGQGPTFRTPGPHMSVGGTKMPSSIARLRTLLAGDEILVMPCCYDALSARLVQRAKFPLTFMSGFSVAASRGLPDTGLISYGEMRDQCLNITETLDIPLLVDGDSGHGNAVNVRRTVLGFAAAGAAGLLIEDQVAPKREFFQRATVCILDIIQIQYIGYCTVLTPDL